MADQEIVATLPENVTSTLLTSPRYGPEPKNGSQSVGKEIFK